MPFRIEPGESVAHAVRRLARHQLGRALDRFEGRDEDSTASDPDEVVHDVRKRLKKARALVRLARGALGAKLAGRVARRYRDAARPLSETRDAGALAETLEELAEHGGEWGLADAFDAARALLRERREEIGRQFLDGTDVLAGLAETLDEASRESARWEIAPDGWDALAPGLGRIYRRGRRAYQAALKDPTDEALHEFRKRAKDLWYALDILGPVRPAYTQNRSGLARGLADLLGDDHDLAVLRVILADPTTRTTSANDLRLLFPLIDSRRDELRAEAFLLAGRLFDERPRGFDARFRAYWAAWVAEAEAARFDSP